MDIADVSMPVVIDDFPNGNVVITPEVTTYVTRYQTFARKTAESIIGLATTLVEAEEELGEEDFLIFCDEVDIKKGDSTYSKLRKIGANASRFTPYLQNLPNTWTTLYELAKLDAFRFQQIASDLNPYMTAKDVSLALGTSKSNKTVADVIDLAISFGTIDFEMKRETYGVLLELQKQFRFTIKESQSFTKQMNVTNLGKDA